MNEMIEIKCLGMMVVDVKRVMFAFYLFFIFRDNLVVGLQGLYGFL